MSGYIGLNLKEMLNQIGESEVKMILSGFYCPKGNRVYPNMPGQNSIVRKGVNR